MKNSIANSLTWIGRQPIAETKAALLIPQYNEKSHCDMEKRLRYFESVARRYEEWLDVIIIDDGSSDGSTTAIHQFITQNKSPLYLAAVFPNARKVGALYATVLHIRHDWVITSDFDTDLQGLENFCRYLPLMRDPKVMGGYFRMLPYEGEGVIFLFQQLEYAFLRGLYRWHRKDRSVRVMPGAGSCYKRDILVKLFNEHSGLRNGEDRETTVLGIKNGYRTHYLSRVQAYTRPPLSYRALLQQRVRWNLGYLETVAKEWDWYKHQIASFSRLGVLTLFDALFIGALFLGPFLLILIICWHWILGLSILGVVLVSGIGWPLVGLFGARGEYREIRGKLLKAGLLFPFIKLSMEWMAWTRAIILFRRGSKKGMKAASRSGLRVRREGVATSSGTPAA